jgi:hypothetical protein
MLEAGIARLAGRAGGIAAVAAAAELTGGTAR